MTRIRIYSVALLIIIDSCSFLPKCGLNFDFTTKEYSFIPFFKDSILVFQNDNNLTDTFLITRKEKELLDFNDPIETGAHHYLQLEISYTNKNFREAPEQDRLLLNIQKSCIDHKISYYGSWMDYWDGLIFNRTEALKNYAYPDTVNNFKFGDKIIPMVLKFQTDTMLWPSSIDREIRIVYWQPDKGVIMYQSRKSGWWTRIK